MHSAALSFIRSGIAYHRVVVAVLILGLAGCSGGHSRNSEGGPMGSGDGGKSAPIPRMEARGDFFGGQVEAEILLARTGALWTRDAGLAGAGDSDRSGGGGHFSGGGGTGGSHGGGHRGGSTGDERGSSANDGGPQAPPIHAINQPGVQLRIRLTNHREISIVVEVADFNSDLGNFVVLPEKIAIAPGASVEADPMVSRLGVSETEIPVTVRLRLEGKSDQQILTLKVVKEPAPVAPAPMNPVSTQETPNPQSR